ncbi:MAG: TatD family hydrolase [Candidatus Thermoplasmatota archaeon]|nr:TatD family hydrolase [Candidatus Thermoplasmatota archaeon]
MQVNGIFYNVFDDHFHLRKDGLFLDAVRSFKKAGGTAINLVNLPDYTFSHAGYYEKLYEITVSLSEAVRKELNVPVVTTLGPYPLDFFFFKNAGMDPVEEMKKGVDLAIGEFIEGNCQCIGEIGTPHFDVDPDARAKIYEVLEYCFSRCADAGSPVMLHTEDLDSTSLRRICTSAGSAGLDPGRVIKHHATSEVFRNDCCIIPSVPASRSAVRDACSTGKPFMLESDYVDDRQHPQRVLPPDSVPKRSLMISQEFPNYEEIFAQAFVELPERLYGLEYKTL